MIERFGEHALRFPLAPGLDRRTLLDALRALPGVTDVVLAEDTGAVYFDGDPPRIEDVLANARPETADPEAKLHEIRVAYDGEDLDALAETTGLSREEIIAVHTAGEYRVAMMGFLPGFAYLTGLDPRLVVPRRAQPRARVPACSVAIAAGYTGVYPCASPGGWHLLGEAVGFTPFGANGATFALGDRVRFVQSARVAEAANPADAPAALATPHLEIRAARGPAIVVDGGRRGHLHEGIPRGGALVRSALARANAAVGNEPDAAAIELYGAIDVLARGSAIALGDDHGGHHALADGESFTLANDGASRVRYLAVSGGLATPTLLGSRTTLLSFEGRPIKRGDLLPVARPHLALTLLPGPDATPDALDAIAAATFTIAPASDRTGTRLEGPAIPLPAAGKSKPLVRGAIEATPSGLIVLGPDHPATGGYPVVAVLADAAQDAFFALPIGQRIRFVIG